MSIPHGYVLDSRATPSTVDHRDVFPLSFAQQRLWFLAQKDRVGDIDISYGLRLKGYLDCVALRRALDRIQARHEALRTVFLLVDGEPVQQITPVGERGFQLIEHDLRQKQNAQTELDRLIEIEAGTSFDLEQGPLIRGHLFRLSEDEYALLLTLHHIVSDGWSMGVLINELSILYGAFLRGEADPLPELEIQYADYAVWQRQWIEGDVMQKQAAYWESALSGAPELLEVPADHPRPAQQNFAGAFAWLVLDEPLTVALKNLSRRHRTTLFMTLLAAWAALLARLTGEQDIAIATPVANRGRAEIENLIGFFVNTLVLRLELSGSPTVSELLKQAKMQTLAAQQHQDLPFEHLVEILQPVRSLAHNPLFQVMFTWHNNARDSLQLPGLTLKPLLQPPHRVARFDLKLFLTESSNTIVGGVEYATSLFELPTIERYLEYFRTLLKAMVIDDTQTVDRLPLLPQAERDQLLYEWNDTGVEFPRERCIHELFEEQVEKSPEATAVVFEGDELTYAELNRRANQLAHYLIELGVRPDARVALCVERGFAMVVALLGVLKAGGAYVPLDPAYPEERLRYMLEDSAPVVLLTQGRLKELFAGSSDVLPRLDLEAAPWRDRPESNPDRNSIGLTSRHLAYVIYTSGSTGTPKGVMVEHRSLVNRLSWMQSAYNLEPQEAVLQKTPFGFDVSVWELFWPLLNGARLVMARPEGHRDPAYLCEEIRRNGVTTVHFVPSLLQTFLEHSVEEDYGALVRVISSGEALPATLVRRFQERLPNAVLHNLYGPTEAAVDVTAWSCPAGFDQPIVPIGRPIANTRIYILDAYRQPVPVGVAGELYVGGVQVARGYLNRAELTAERFLRDPFVKDADARMYRTGDLGRWLPDGNIEFLGRNDFQVKIRGFRIELGEIENRLREHPGVREAAVLAREDTPGDKRLVAYYTEAPGAAEEIVAGAEALHRHLTASLPEYMVPAAYVRLESLPLTPNGKLDRKALPAPEADAYSAAGYEPPQGEIETALAAIWAEVLKLERVGRHDNFFQLGGHSLLAIRVITRMRRNGFQLDVGAFFATSTLRELASSVGADSGVIEVPLNLIGSDCEVISPEMLPLVHLTQNEIDRIVRSVPGRVANLQDIYPLAPLQEGILFHHLMGGEGDPYLLGNQLGFDSRICLNSYLAALQRVVDRHDILRTSIQWEGLVEPLQVVWRKAPLHIEEIEFDRASGDAAEQLYARFDPRRFRIDVRQAPLLRMYIVYDSTNDRWLMMQLLHHLIGDHTTLDILHEEVEAHLLEQGGQLPVPLPFRNFVAQARLGISQQKHQDFFRQMLVDVDEPTAPFGLLDVQGDGTGIEEARLALDYDLARRLREQGRRLGVSTASLCHVAWAQVLAKASGREDVVFGTVLFGRMQGGEGSERMMGPFINTLPVRILIGEEGVESALRRTHILLADLMRHEHAPLALAQRCSAVSAPTPLFSALLNYRHFAGAIQASSNETKPPREGIQWLRGEERTNYPITLAVDDLGKSLTLTVQTLASIGPLRVCKFMSNALASLVQALETSPTTALRACEVLPVVERNQLLYEWNDTGVEFPRERCIHELFEEQVEKSPEATAVVFEGDELTYAELNRRANQLAHYLIELGVRPDARVALCVERGFAMVVALLGVLKAGGAYVPLDPAYPEERLRYMLEDSAPVVLLTQGRLKELFAGSSDVLPRLDLEAAPWRDRPESNPDRNSIGLTSRHLAYVIYTSGSTGTPKGVMVEHRSLVNRLSWMQSAYNLEPQEAVLQKTPFGFDVSVWELFWPLLNGARLVMARPEGHRDPAYLCEEIRRNGVTTVHFVPSLLQTFLEHSVEEDYGALVRVISSGEALPATLVRRFQERLPNAVLHNLYGPTEAAVDVTAWSCPAGFDQPIVPIGRPIANTRIYILDAYRQPVPVGVAGELYVGGVQVARGYLNRAELTAERFLRDPFVKDADARMYRTGDLGRWLPDGNIEFLGRNDFQVKIRGFRIELGEIENRLREHPGVREAAVLAREDTPGDKRLVAYYTEAPGAAEEIVAGAEALHRHLTASLPEYMVPAAYVRLESLPLTPNGKLDRKALPAPEADAYSAAGYEPPQGEIETALAAIWAEVLKLERVGRHDNFFQLGGHSLLAIRVITRIRQVLGVDVVLSDLFVHPKMADFAHAVQGAACTDLPPITLAERGEKLPLSFAQQRLWFLAQMGVSETYHIPFSLRLQGGLDCAALRRSLDRILARHEALRTTFALVEGEPVQKIISAEDSRFLLLEDDLRDHAQAKSELNRLVALEACTSFDLEHGPLIRGRLLRLGQDDHALLLTMHHIVSDGWSMGVLLSELGALYRAFLYDQADPLPELYWQYGDYALWQRRWIKGDILQRQANYWKTTLAGIPTLLELPTDHVRPSQQNYTGAFARLALDAELTANLKVLSQRHGGTLFMTLLAAWAALLARLSGQQDVVIGTPVANRGRAEIENLIGFFVNTLALRLDLSGSPTVGELLKQVKGQALAAQQHQDIPFEHVVEILQPVRSLAHSPLFQVMFTWQNSPEGRFVLPGLELQPLQAATPTVAKFDLTLSLMEASDTIVGGIEYATSLFEPPTIERYLEYFRTLLKAMVADDTQIIDRLPLLSQAERDQLLYEWNDTDTEFPSDQCVHQLFEQQVAQAPDAVAVVFQDNQLSYAELNRRANQLAHYLIELGVKPDARVAICVERSFEMVVALLGVLKAGGAYVPLDPAYPEERLRYMLEDSAPVVLLTQSRLKEQFIGLGERPPVLHLDDLTPPWQNLPHTNTDTNSIGLTPNHLSYVIYTSGSTGIPKGVAVQHRGVSNLLHWYIEESTLSDRDIVLVLTSTSFDLTQKNIIGPLLVGGQISLASALFDARAIQKLLAIQNISMMNLPPSVFHALMDGGTSDVLGKLRRVYLGGEPIQPSRLLEISGPRPDFINHYGPTECTDVVAYYRMPPDFDHSVSIPIGRPIANTRIYILDAYRQPVPVGVAGELYVGGVQVARGYLNRAELTAERFLRDPFVKDADARMYRTGDLGRWLPDGNIEFLGRNDFQVKIRGFRIELGEIENRLREHPGVREAAVLAREDTPGDKRLVAYYTEAPGAAEEIVAGAEALHRHLTASLPEYMVPAAYVRLESLPLTPNGKLDRKALPAPEADAYSAAGYEPPQGEIETALAAIWAEVLKLERVGRHDNFFQLGGHSLLAIRVITRIRQVLGVDVVLSDLFVHPKMADFAHAVQGAACTDLPPITLAERGEKLPLSFAQQRLWFLAQMGVSETYHIPFSLRLQGGLDCAALRRSLDRILARHEALRTTFALVEGEPVQKIISAEDSRFLLLEDDLRDHAQAKSELNRLVALEACTSFDLEHGPLIRGRLLRLGQDDHALLLTMHHIVSDGWSMGVLLSELSALYRAFLYDQADPLPELYWQYGDYALWQRRWIKGDILQRQANYWKTTLAGIPTLLELPTDHVRPSQQNYTGAFARLALDAELTANLKVLSQRHGGTLFMTLLAAWAALLARLSGQQDVVIGTPVANRGRAEIENLIGFFVNTLALRLDLSGSPTVGELLKQVKGQALAAQQHQDIPFEHVVEILQPVRSLAHSPLFQVMFTWQNSPEGRFVLPGLELQPLQAATPTVAKFDLTLSLMEASDTIVGGIEYATSLFEPPTIERYLEYFRTLLKAMVADDTQIIDRLPLLSQAERDQLLYEWNDTDTEFPSDQCVHQLFEQQVAQAPDAVAVVFQDNQLSYAELNRRANQLAHYLIELGVKPDARVAICVERSFEMVVALLGVLKAGGAYVPLDPAYPEERLRYMLEDSAPVVLLTQSRLKEQFAGSSKVLPCLDLEAALWRDQPESNPDLNSIGLTSRRLAYVIYTSGSTGTPKGVMVEHRNLVNHMNWMGLKFPLKRDQAVIQKTPFSFDASVWEFYAALLVGGRLVLSKPSEHLNPSGLLDAVRKNNVQVIQVVPTLLDILLATPSFDSCTSLRHVYSGGEPLTAMSVRRLNAQLPGADLINLYGPTETTINATFWVCPKGVLERDPPIGRPIANTRVYILDGQGRPVPIGVAGELYIGGAGVARGYLNRAELTAERFLRDPFVDDTDARMYRTGDLGRWLPDGNIEFLGRNDFQVKIRGFRIELGEIESRLREHPGVREAIVLAREDVPGDKRLVAYYITRDRDAAGASQSDAEALRSHLFSMLPEYMVPTAYVRLGSLPLTPNGKLNRKALPAPDIDAYPADGYEPPQGEIETKLAAIWADVLKLERVGRHDNFFQLGGHSLLALTLIERMRRHRFLVEVRSLFEMPTLAQLASTVSRDATIAIPPNKIPFGCQAITPQLLPLIELTQPEIDRVVGQVSGGAPNVQDIYPLAPLQEGILFHHLIGGDGDPYLQSSQLRFKTRARLESYLNALKATIERHDILRTSIVWEGLTEPVQVVWRVAPPHIEQIEFNSGIQNVAEQLYARFDPRKYRIDVRQAPLLRLYIAQDTESDSWHALQLLHHLVGDHNTLGVMQEEIQAQLLGRGDLLPTPLPFRNLVAQARMGSKQQEHEAFFKELLGDVEEPTSPFGLGDAQGDGTGIHEARLQLEPVLARRMKERARKLGVSTASLCHVAWAQVLARVSGHEDVVFGTVLFGRMQSGEGGDRVMGPFINTLPVRIHLGKVGAEETVRRTHSQLADLMHHEHASLALAQRCSAVRAPMPLFSALFNYRHSPNAIHRPTAEALQAWDGIGVLYGEERTNYPLTFSVDDLGDGFMLTVQVQASIQPMRVCAFMRMALERLLEALDESPATPLSLLDVLPQAERDQLLYAWNDTGVEFPRERCIHELFEEQVEKSPEATAVVFEGEELTYAELNRRANQLAHYLIELGVRPDARVALCVERGFAMVVALLGVLKAGGAYVPLDPAYPEERLRYMLEDSAPVVLLTQGRLKELFAGGSDVLPRLELEAAPWRDRAESNPDRNSIGLTSRHLAYVIYTSGSTGTPKGVAIEHSNAVNLIYWGQLSFTLEVLKRTLFSTSLNFDMAVFECFVPITVGAAFEIVGDVLELAHAPREVTLVNTVPSAIDALVEVSGVPKAVRTINLGGEPLKRKLVERIFAQTDVDIVSNLYGPSETTTYSTSLFIKRDSGFAAHIGRPIANTRVYILDGQGRPVPIGVAGELYIGGAGVARGYLNRAELTAQRFLRDPFVDDTGARMYRTGDLGRWLADGNIEFLGRNDFQVKIRGFRIELGEIESRLREHSGVREAIVLAREDVPGDKRLVAYYITRDRDAAGASRLDAEALRSHLFAVLPEYMVPTAYVRLESLPLTPNGKLDRKALPAPDTDAYPADGYEPPQGEIETKLAAIWADVLKLERVGRRDNFFQLGGHSLLAVRATSSFQRGSVTVSAADIFKYPTIESFAAQVASRTPALTNAAVLLREGGMATPLFFVHCGVGELLYISKLAPHIDPEIPVYGLPPRRMDEEPLLTLEGMATRMVQMVRSVQPVGPYRIAGWSFGGMLAYELAQQLIGADQEVSFLGILDTPCSADGIPTPDGPLDHEVIKNVALPTRLWPSRETEKVADSVAATVNFSSLLPYYWLQPIPIRVHLFAAKKHAAPEPTLGWKDVLPEDLLHLIPIEGTHHSMLQPPNIKELGQAMSAAVRNVTKNSKGLPQRKYLSIVPLNSKEKDLASLFCIPGAGADVSSFIDFVAQLDGAWSVYGIQPRGVDGVMVPHSTVSAAVDSYFLSIDEMDLQNPIHLLGHSFGGWAAFELAQRLVEAGRDVASITILDSETPDETNSEIEEYSNISVTMKWIELIEEIVEHPLDIKPSDLTSYDESGQRRLIHSYLVREGLLPKRAHPDTLRGPLRTFAMSLRTQYRPGKVYSGPLRLVLVNGWKIDHEAKSKRNSRVIMGWKRLAPNLVSMQVPGSHTSVLKQPHVSTLARLFHL